ncbi:hypothetical protein [Ectothiorhodospira sp. BSL-9]|uniref:hypothetical protein n=1 Tax=Ectothiorhodospira sp. BSL-9 TaxID=1442136 RepID=UPI0007B51EDF|nr:hypothetical protein [Ectothiorhodospira sp. BSL-9]
MPDAWLDLRAGSTPWELEPAGDATSLKAGMHIALDFWVPPFSSPTSMERATLRDTINLRHFIERDSEANP